MPELDLKPTAEMAANAARGLELREKHGKGGTAVGVARARDIKNRANLSPSTVRRMHSFFSRHEGNQKGGEDDAGYIAWLLWGGDAGKAWAARKSEQIDKSESARFASPKVDLDYVRGVGEDYGRRAAKRGINRLIDDREALSRVKLLKYALDPMSPMRDKIDRAFDAGWLRGLTLLKISDVEHPPKFKIGDRVVHDIGTSKHIGKVVRVLAYTEPEPQYLVEFTTLPTGTPRRNISESSLQKSEHTRSRFSHDIRLPKGKRRLNIDEAHAALAQMGYKLGTVRYDPAAGGSVYKVTQPNGSVIDMPAAKLTDFIYEKAKHMKSGTKVLFRNPRTKAELMPLHRARMDWLKAHAGKPESVRLAQVYLEEGQGDINAAHSLKAITESEWRNLMFEIETAYLRVEHGANAPTHMPYSRAGAKATMANELFRVRIGNGTVSSAEFMEYARRFVPNVSRNDFLPDMVEKVNEALAGMGIATRASVLMKGKDFSRAGAKAAFAHPDDAQITSTQLIRGNGRKYEILSRKPASAEARAQIGQTDWLDIRGANGAQYIVQVFNNGTYRVLSSGGKAWQGRILASRAGAKAAFADAKSFRDLVAYARFKFNVNAYQAQDIAGRAGIYMQLNPKVPIEKAMDEAYRRSNAVLSAEQKAPNYTVGGGIGRRDPSLINSRAGAKAAFSESAAWIAKYLPALNQWWRDRTDHPTDLDASSDRWEIESVLDDVAEHCREAVPREAKPSWYAAALRDVKKIPHARKAHMKTKFAAEVIQKLSGGWVIEREGGILYLAKGSEAIPVPSVERALELHKASVEGRLARRTGGFMSRAGAKSTHAMPVPTIANPLNRTEHHGNAIAAINAAIRSGNANEARRLFNLYAHTLNSTEKAGVWGIIRRMIGPQFSRAGAKAAFAIGSDDPYVLLGQIEYELRANPVGIKEWTIPARLRTVEKLAKIDNVPANSDFWRRLQIAKNNAREFGIQENSRAGAKSDGLTLAQRIAVEHDAKRMANR